MRAIYNEIEPFAAAWLRELEKRGRIAPGVVDERSIEDLKPADVAGPGQRHFFAGIGGWSYALRLAGVPDDVSVWTGSCPCQPFSAAGSRRGTSDPRHLWPAWFALIRECRPAIIFGEQVASRDGLAWLDAVYADLERCDYAVGAADLCAAGVGAPHIRQRLYFVAYADETGLGEFGIDRLCQDRHAQSGDDSDRCGEDGRMADTGQEHRRSRTARKPESDATGRRLEDSANAELDRSTRLMADAVPAGRPEGRTGSGNKSIARVRGACGLAKTDESLASKGRESRSRRLVQPASDASTGFWSNAEWIPCIDGVARPVEPGTFPLAHGVSGRMAVRRAVQQADSALPEEIEEHWYNRVGALVGFGNAIVPQVAAIFIQGAAEVMRCR